MTLTGPAPEGGALVGITSTNRDAVKVPATITIAAGQTSGTFFAESSTVGAPTAVNIVATYGGTSNGATLNVGPQPLKAVIRLNTKNTHPCRIASTGGIGQFHDPWPCDFNASESTGSPVLFRWFIRSSVRKEDWETKDPITFGAPTCAVFRGHPQSAPGFTQIEVGLEVEDQRGNRSGFTTTTMTLETKGSCGYPD